MMWIAICVLTALAVLSVLAPLAVRRRETAAGGADRVFYEAQVAEIERDRARGLLNDADAASARAEAGRRLIERHGANAGAASTSTFRRRVAALVAIALLPLAALVLYGRLGNPDLSDKPLAARLNATPGASDLYAAVARIERHLAQNPDDARGWEVIAPVYLRTGRPQDAARAWGEVIRIAGPSAERYTAIGEALVFADQGKVPVEALAAFDKALEHDPVFPQARFYKGLAAEQAGNKDLARDVWTKLLADAPADAPWAAAVKNRVAALGPQVKVPAPDELVARTMTALPKDEQQEAIRGMVARLAGRLKENGRDADGWAMLVNAYNVLKEPDKARAALDDARKALADDGAALEKLKLLARQLGLEG